MPEIHSDLLDDMPADRYLEQPGRRDNVDDLAASIAVIGVLEPLVVIPQPDTGRWTIYMGHRRRAAAHRAAELITANPEDYGLDAVQAAERAESLLQLPCHERGDLDQPGHDVLSQIAENRERLDLTDADVARGLQLALDDGLDAKVIAAATGVKLATVRAAEKLAALPDSAHAAMAAGQLDIDQAAQLHEYADDPKAVERILRSSHLGYALAAEGQKREDKARTATLRATLTEAGFTLVSKPKDFPWTSRAAALSDLGDDGVQRAPQDPEPVDGHAVFVEGGYGGPRAVHICLDPDAHGHQRLRHTGYVSPEEIARREAQDQARTEHAQQMAAAREVRHKFLRTLIGSQKAAARHIELLLTVAAQWPSLLTSATRHPLADQLCGEIERWTPGRSHQRAVTLAVLGADHAAAEDSWTRDHRPSLWWWEQLARLGYDLTPVEEAHRDAQQAAHDERQAERAHDDDDQDDDGGDGEELGVDDDAIPDELGEHADGEHVLDTEAATQDPAA